MSNNEQHPIQKRIVLGLPFCLKTPMCLSNGEEIETDIDVMRNFDGVPIIPGASLTGAIRDYLSLTEKCDSDVWGFSEKDKEIQRNQKSTIYVSDTLLEKTNIDYRDGIQLGEEAGVENKFDWEIVDVGAQGCFYLEIVVRDGNKEESILKQLQTAFWGMQRGKLRLGYRKNRGFGQVHLSGVYRWEFGKDNLKEWLDFKKPKLRPNQEGWENNRLDLETWLQEAKEHRQYASISVPLKLDGCISIRRYSTKSGEADYEHITSGGKAIVPGTSWNGVIRKRFAEIGQSLGISEIGEWIKTWFGSLDHRSYVVIGESVLEGAHFLPISRTRINRFDASTVMGNLYNEQTAVGGETNLVIQVEKAKDDEWQAVLGLLWLVVQDIQMGYLSVGGLRAIGRGIFSENGPVDWAACEQEECELALVAWLAQSKRGGE